jgi:hypothetical protein
MNDVATTVHSSGTNCNKADGCAHTTSSSDTVHPTPQYTLQCC